MATVQTAIVDRALRIVIGVETAGTAAQSSLALTALNAMIDSWRNDGLMASSVVDLSKMMVPGTASYTFGTAGTFSTTRPLEIIDAYMTQNGGDTPVSVITVEQYDAIETKSNTSEIVTSVYYNPTFPAAELKVYPVPSAANTLHVVARTDLTSYAALSDTVSVPPGWERALYSNLAIELAPEYGATLTQEVYATARESKAAIKRTNNSNPILMVAENAAMFSNHRSNILIDE